MNLNRTVIAHSPYGTRGGSGTYPARRSVPGAYITRPAAADKARIYVPPRRRIAVPEPAVPPDDQLNAAAAEPIRTEPAGEQSVMAEPAPTEPAIAASAGPISTDETPAPAAEPVADAVPTGESPAPVPDLSPVVSDWDNSGFRRRAEELLRVIRPILEEPLTAGERYLRLLAALRPFLHMDDSTPAPDFDRLTAWLRGGDESTPENPPDSPPDGPPDGLPPRREGNAP